jgi:hypothetical protein
LGSSILFTGDRIDDIIMQLDLDGVARSTGWNAVWDRYRTGPTEWTQQQVMAAVKKRKG